MLHPRTLVAVAFCASIGCAPGGSGPEALRVSQGVDAQRFDLITFRWLPPPSGELTGYQVEWRGAGGVWQPLASLGPEKLSTTIDTGLAIPDDGPIEFRLRALPGDADSRSTTAMLVRGVRPPALSCTSGGAPCTFGPTGLGLQITNRSPAATHLALSRSRVPPGGGARVTGPTFTIGKDESAFLDTLGGDWSEESTYDYTLVAVSPRGSSQPVTLGTRPLPLAAPSGVTIAAAAGGLQVSFQGTSPRATCYEVRRRGLPYAGWDHTVADCLPPPPPGGTVSMLDLEAAPSGLQVYTVTARGAFTESAPAQATWIPPAPAGFTVRPVTIAPATSALRLASGAFLTAVASDEVTLHAPGPTGTVSLTIPAAWSSTTPEPVAMAQASNGTLHALVPEWRYGEEGVGLLHATFDGAAWAQVVQERGAFRERFVLDRGLDGRLRAAWMTSDLVIAPYVPAGSPHHIAWNFQPAFVSGPAVTGDAEGVTHVVYETASGLAHTFDGPGGWQTEPVPSLPRSTNPRLFAGPGILRLVSNEPWPWLVERTAAGWGTPRALGPSYGMYQVPTCSGSSQDGSTVVVATSSGIWILGPDGDREVLREITGLYVVAAGADSAGKAWVLEAYPPELSGAGPALLFEEQ